MNHREGTARHEGISGALMRAGIRFEDQHAGCLRRYVAERTSIDALLR
jgi:hypothetical protein